MEEKPVGLGRFFQANRATMTVPSFIPDTGSNGELHKFRISYRLDGETNERTHDQESKNVKNALASFSRAVTKPNRILGIRRVVRK